MVLTETTGVRAHPFIEFPLQLHEFLFLGLNDTVEHFNLLVCFPLILRKLRLHIHRFARCLEKLVISLRKTPLHVFDLLHHRLILEFQLRELIDLTPAVWHHLREGLAVV